MANLWYLPAPAWMATFADLMSLLMCFFVLLLSFSQMDLSKFKNPRATWATKTATCPCHKRRWNYCVNNGKATETKSGYSLRPAIAAKTCPTQLTSADEETECIPNQKSDLFLFFLLKKAGSVMHIQK